MKYIYEYNRYTDTRSSKVDLGDKPLLDYLQEKVPWYLENIENIVPIFRGLQYSTNLGNRYTHKKKVGDQEIDVPNVLKISPSKFKRKAANTQNLYIEMMDDSPLWEDYPSRSKSIICSTSQHRAADYGPTYRVIPLKENSKFAVCSHHDVFQSFNYLISKVNELFYNDKPVGIGGIPTFQNWFFRAFGVPMEDSLEIIKWKIEQFEHNLKNYPDLVRSVFKDKFYDAIESDEMDIDDLMDTIYEWMSPENNKFQLINYNRNTTEIPFIVNSGNTSNRELWTEEDCLLVPYFEMFKIEKELIPKS